MNSKNASHVGRTVNEAFEKGVKLPVKKGTARKAIDGQEVIIRSSSSEPMCSTCWNKATCSALTARPFRLADRHGKTIEMVNGSPISYRLNEAEADALLQPIYAQPEPIYLPVALRTADGKVRKIKVSEDGTKLEMRDHRRHLVWLGSGKSHRSVLDLTRDNQDGTVLDKLACITGLFNVLDATIIG